MTSRFSGSSHLARALWTAGLFGLLWAPDARSTEDDTRLWSTLALSGERVAPLHGSLFVQPRFADDIGELERLLIRPSISLSVSEWARVSLGYDAHLIDSPRDSTEHRIWQQVGLDTPAGRLGLHHRARLEERFLDRVSGVSWRLRYRLRATHPIGRSAFDAVLSNEIFVDLNSRRLGPRSGFGEDRAFAGVRFRLSQDTAFEGGYQLQYVDRPARDAANHVLMIGFAATLR